MLKCLGSTGLESTTCLWRRTDEALFYIFRINLALTDNTHKIVEMRLKGSASSSPLPCPVYPQRSKLHLCKLDYLLVFAVVKCDFAIEHLHSFCDCPLEDT